MKSYREHQLDRFIKASASIEPFAALIVKCNLLIDVLREPLETRAYGCNMESVWFRDLMFDVRLFGHEFFELVESRNDFKN